VTIAQIGNLTSYKDSSAVANTGYKYRVIAFDAAGNLSQPSTDAPVTTPKPPVADTQAPSVPSGVSAAAVSTSQINLKWDASADNVGVAKYNFYRSTNGGTASKIATVTTTSFGDANLSGGTTYSYYITAEDAAGNASAASSTVKASTQQPSTKKKSRIKGKVTTIDGQRFGGAHVTIWVNGDKQLYHTRDNGNYAISRLAAGTYTVEYASHDNDFTPETFTITVGEGKTVVKNVSLKSK
jgi:chitodextrinase